MLASIWRGAWEAGQAQAEARVKSSQLRAVPRPRLVELYLDKEWAKSVTIKKMRRRDNELRIED